MSDLFNIVNGKIVKSNLVDIKTNIQNIIRNRIDNVDFDESTIIGQVDNILVEIVNQCDNEIIKANNKFSITGTGDVDETAKIFKFIRRTATNSLCNVNFVGEMNTEIPEGYIVSDINDNKWATIEKGIIKTTNITLMCKSVVGGKIMADINTITNILTPISGLSNITNLQSAIVGYDEETDYNLQQRIIDGRYTIYIKGFLYSFQAIFQQMQDVVDCKVLENFEDDEKEINGLTLKSHSIAIIIIGGANSEIAKNIAIYKSLGCGVNGDNEVIYINANEESMPLQTYEIYRPAIVNSILNINVNKLQNTPVNYKDLLKQQIQSYISQNPFKIMDNVFASNFLKAINSNLVNISNITLRKTNGSPIVNNIQYEILEYPLFLDSNILINEV